MNLLNRRLLLALLVVALAGTAARLVLLWTVPVTGLAVVQTVTLVLYLGWLLAETPTTVRSSRRAETATDRGTVNVYATFRLATLLTALFVPGDWDSYQPWMPAAVAVFALAVGFRLWAITALGRFYSHRVRITGDHQVIEHGPYRLVRHPAYTGMAVAHAAFVLLFLNPFSAGVLVALLLPTLVVRIMIEEKVLLRLPEYAGFAAQRKRLIPWVW